MHRSIITVALVVAAAAATSAQQPAPPGQRPSRPAAGTPTTSRPATPASDVPNEEPQVDPPTLPEAQLAAMLDTYAIVQAQNQLSISDEKYGVFAARLKKLQDTRRKNQRARRQIVQELRRIAGPRAAGPVDETAIRTQLAALRSHDERAAAELRQAYDALDEVLDARQQARYRIFEEVIEQRKLDLLVRARERARGKRDGS